MTCSPRDHGLEGLPAAVRGAQRLLCQTEQSRSAVGASQETRCIVGDGQRHLFSTEAGPRGSRRRVPPSWTPRGRPPRDSVNASHPAHCPASPLHAQAHRGLARPSRGDRFPLQEPPAGLGTRTDFGHPESGVCRGWRLRLHVPGPRAAGPQPTRWEGCPRSSGRPPECAHWQRWLLFAVQRALRSFREVTFVF